MCPTTPIIPCGSPVRPEAGTRSAPGWRRADVHARKYFYPLITEFDCYRGRPGFDSSLTPIALQASRQVVTLPLYPELTEGDVERICSLILGKA